MVIEPSALNALIIGAFILIWGFVFRLVMTRRPDSSLAKGLAFIY